MLNHCLRQGAAAILGFAIILPAAAADWVPVIQVGDNVREIDSASIAGTPPVMTYTTRHVFGSPDEYRISRKGIKYLVITGRADCSKRTTARLAIEAYDENMALVSKQVVQKPEEAVVAPDSIDEAVLKHVCQGK